MGRNRKKHQNGTPVPLAGGLGGSSAAQPLIPESLRDGPGIRDTRLIERAIREGWPVEEHYRAPLINRQVRIAIDPNVSPGEATKAFNAVLAASRQNLEIVKTLAGIDRQAEPVTVNVGVQIVQREDFYANDAHSRTAQTVAASDTGAAIPGPVQDAGVRPPVGQNGHGVNGSNGRARTNGRHAEGCH